MRSYIAEFKMNYFKQKCLDANKKKMTYFVTIKRENIMLYCVTLQFYQIYSITM